VIHDPLRVLYRAGSWLDLRSAAAIDDNLRVEKLKTIRDYRKTNLKDCQTEYLKYINTPLKGDDRQEFNVKNQTISRGAIKKLRRVTK
jgi:hypothetical protein